MPRPVATPLLFPYSPDGNATIKEIWSYPSLVKTAYDGSEWRQSLRQRPLLKTSWQCVPIDIGEAVDLESRLFAGVKNWWYVPLWGGRSQITNVAGDLYTFDRTNNYQLHAPFFALIVREGVFADLMTVAATDPTTQLTGVSTLPHQAGDWYVPVQIGTLTPPWSLQRAGLTGIITVGFELDLVNTTPLPDYVPATVMDGIEVFTFHPSLPDGFTTTDYEVPSMNMGTVRGLMWSEPHVPAPLGTHSFDLVMFSPDEISQFRRWLATRRGRKYPLWIATYQDNIQLVAPAVAGQDYLDIVACSFDTRYMPFTARRRLIVLHNSETVEPIKVTGVTEPSPGVERLQLSAPLTYGVLVNERISFLVYARLSSDDITIEHQAYGIATSQVAFTELPNEAPP